MLLAMERVPARVHVLQEYVKRGYLRDALTIAHDMENIVKRELSFDREPLPTGIQNWDDFGSLDGCPGRVKWHPGYKKHKLLGWLIAMRMLHAMEIAREMQRKNPIISENKNKATRVPVAAGSQRLAIGNEQR